MIFKQPQTQYLNEKIVLCKRITKNHVLFHEVKDFPKLKKHMKLNPNY